MIRVFADRSAELAPPAIPHAAARRVPRSLQPRGRILPRSGSGAVPAQSGDPVAAQQLAWQALENLRQQQASALAYFDVFWLSAVVPLVLVALVLLMKRSVAEKRGRIGGE